MTSRREQLKSMFGNFDLPASGQERDLNEQSRPPEAASPKRAVAGSVKAMGLSLEALNEQVSDARRIRESLASGERVVEVDPELIDPSPFADRLSIGPNDEGFASLKESIRDGGQEVPVLLRPHPDAAQAGRYQSAYGHRRILAARELGLRVKAIVKALSDIELATAQGRENAERRDLSFIERAMFARTLVRSGLDRSIAQLALSIHKSEMSRMLQVADAVPDHIVRAIGAAPKIGRSRWQALGEMLSDKSSLEKASREIVTARFLEADSDHRFQIVIGGLASKSANSQARATLKDSSGKDIGTLQATRGKGSLIALSGDAGDGFGAFIAERLPELHAQFIAARSKD